MNQSKPIYLRTRENFPDKRSLNGYYHIKYIENLIQSTKEENNSLYRLKRNIEYGLQGYNDIIDYCKESIDKGEDVDYFTEKLQEAESNYYDTKSALTLINSYIEYYLNEENLWKLPSFKEKC